MPEAELLNATDGSSSRHRHHRRQLSESPSSGISDNRLHHKHRRQLSALDASDGSTSRHRRRKSDSGERNNAQHSDNEVNSVSADKTGLNASVSHQRTGSGHRWSLSGTQTTAAAGASALSRSNDVLTASSKGSLSQKNSSSLPSFRIESSAEVSVTSKSAFKNEPTSLFRPTALGPSLGSFQTTTTGVVVAPRSPQRRAAIGLRAAGRSRSSESAVVVRRALALAGASDFDIDGDSSTRVIAGSEEESSDYSHTSASVIRHQTHSNGRTTEKASSKHVSFLAEADDSLTSEHDPRPETTSAALRAHRPSSSKKKKSRSSSSSSSKKRHSDVIAAPHHSSDAPYHSCGSSHRSRRKTESADARRRSADSFGDSTEQSEGDSGSDNSVDEFLRMQALRKSADPSKRAKARFAQISGTTLQRSRLCKAFFEERYRHIFNEIERKGVFNPLQERRDRALAEAAEREAHEAAALRKKSERERRKIELEARCQALAGKTGDHTGISTSDLTRNSERESGPLVPVVHSRHAADLDTDDSDGFFDKLIRDQAELVNETRASQDQKNQSIADLSSGRNHTKRHSGRDSFDIRISRDKPPSEISLSAKPSSTDDIKKRGKINRLVPKIVRKTAHTAVAVPGSAISAVFRRGAGGHSDASAESNNLRTSPFDMSAVDTLMNTLGSKDSSIEASEDVEQDLSPQNSPEQFFSRALITDDDRALLDAIGSEKTLGHVETRIETLVKTTQDLLRSQIERLELVAERAQELEQNQPHPGKSISEAILRVSNSATEIHRVNTTIRHHRGKVRAARENTQKLISECNAGLRSLDEKVERLSEETARSTLFSLFVPLTGSRLAKLWSYMVVIMSSVWAHLPSLHGRARNAEADRGITSNPSPEHSGDEHDEGSQAALLLQNTPKYFTENSNVLSASAILRNDEYEESASAILRNDEYEESDQDTIPRAPVAIRPLPRRLGPSMLQRRASAVTSAEFESPRRRAFGDGPLRPAGLTKDIHSTPAPQSIPQKKFQRMESLLSDVFTRDHTSLGARHTSYDESELAQLPNANSSASFTEEDAKLNSVAPLVEMHSKYGSYAQSQFDEISRLVSKAEQNNFN